MEQKKANRAVAALLGITATLAASAASAEYRVTAFSNTKAYGALINMNLPKAEEAFVHSSMDELDFEEANNFCVTKILAEDYFKAIAACESAVEKVKETKMVSAFTKKTAKATIYSNLEVATALAGEL